MKIDTVTLRLIASPLKEPFATHLQLVTRREALIIEVRDRDGCCGYGESDPFSSPWYSPETIDSAKNILENFLIPRVLAAPLHHPEQLDQVLDGVRGNRMAKSGLSQAVWDLYARQKAVYLGKLVGGTRQQVHCGAVIAAREPERALEQLDRYAQDGYKRYKIKISRGSDHQLLSAVRQNYPHLPLIADANSAFTLADAPHIKELDVYQLQMIEQPLAYNDFVDHAQLQSQIKTSICLDESICSSEDMKTALALNSCRIVAIKMARLGGWKETLTVYQLCAEHKIPVWCGGMIEFGIAKAHNLALASLPNFTIPGDLFASSRYWQEDIIEPEIRVQNGSIRLPERPGIGFAINQKQLERLTQMRRTFTR
ncbi:MAG: o-succinylbenzoate synthase [Sporolactobacillus sp.]